MVFNIKILLFSRGIKFFSNCKNPIPAYPVLCTLELRSDTFIPGKRLSYYWTVILYSPSDNNGIYCRFKPAVSRIFGFFR